jgi:hypothetical protein
MHHEAVLRTGAERPLVVGDRMDTDVEGAQRAGADSLLVLTGVTDPDELVQATANHRPTFVGEDLRALFATPGEVGVRPGTTRCGGWSAVINDGRIDALRALCGAAWAADELPAGVAEALAKAGW